MRDRGHAPNVGVVTRRPLLSVLFLALFVSAPAAEAASYKFKVNLSMVQTTDWAQKVRHPHPGDGYCGTRDVHYVYSGEGDGQLRAKVRDARTTFSGNSAFMQSTEIKVPGTVVSNASEYSISREGDAENCDVPPPPQFPAGDGCNPLVRHPGTARSFLLVQRGRLILTGGFYRRDMNSCRDPSLYTGVVGYGGRPGRRDVDELIRRKRVRSIELEAEDRTVFNAENLSSFGANSLVLEGSGEGVARWSVKLTRIR